MLFLVVRLRRLRGLLVMLLGLIIAGFVLHATPEGGGHIGGPIALEIPPIRLVSGLTRHPGTNLRAMGLDDFVLVT